jgi:hypothetical protein
VQPYGGPAVGGTLLTIFGAHLHKLTAPLTAPLCRFGWGGNSSTTSATVQEGGERAVILCVSPPLQGERSRRDVALNVAQNGQDFTQRPLRFLYYSTDGLVVTSLQPSGGPHTGGTTVQLSGREIGTSRGGLQCYFGSTAAMATAIDENSVHCISPPFVMASNASTYATQDVRVTVNGDPAAASSRSQTFTYFVATVALSISSIYPQSGPSAGGTDITIVGHGFRDLGGVRCRFGSAALVTAQAPPPPPCPRPLPGKDGDIRLANGGSDGLEGRVEIFHNGVWGTVCDDLWDLEDARVVCRQLGFEDALNATCCGVYGPGEGPIWLDNVNCVANADRLDRCTSLGWGIHNCDHHEDAGVKCLPYAPPGMAPSTPPGMPPPPIAPWSRLDDYQLMRSSAGAHLGLEDAAFLKTLGLHNQSDFDSFVCRSPSLDKALNGSLHRAVLQNVELVVTINANEFGHGANFTYYPR